MVVVAISAIACGCHRDHAAPHPRDAQVVTPAPLPAPLPPLGVDRITRFNYPYGDGGAAYAKAQAAYKAKPRDWAAVRAGCEAAIAKDPDHLDAQYLLGVALARGGDAAGAADHLALALAGDYFAYGASLGSDEDLASFRATPEGAETAQLATRIGAEYAKLAESGLWVVGRRSPFKWPSKDGVRYDAPRGELYAYDRASKRFVRLTHTDHEVAGFVRAPGSGEVAILGFDKVDHEADKPPVIARAWVLELDPATWKPLGPRVTLPSARAVAVGYAAGDQLLVAGRGDADWAVSSVDRTTGKLAQVAQPLPQPRIELALDDGRTVHAATVPGVDATWADDGTAPQLKVGPTAITVPESGKAARDTVALAPGGASLAFATAVDPCAKDALPSLYVADARSGALHHVLTAKSRFATRWLDPTTLAYDDGDNAIRLWDTTTGRELERIENKPGIALDVLALGAGACKAPPVETAGSGDEMPPEDAGSGSAGSAAN